VGDITDLESIEATAKWKNQVEEVVALTDSPIPMVLAVNKVDVVEEKVDNQEELEHWQN
jgi:GTPase Era involved in 16S rRNA processing